MEEENAERSPEGIPHVAGGEQMVGVLLPGAITLSD